MLKNLFIVISLMILMQLKCVAQDINVAFTIDKNYPIFTQIVIFSILENNLSDNHYNFFIAENDLTKRQKAQMQKFVEKRNQDITFINVSTDRIDNGRNYYENRYMLGRIPKIGMARLLLPELLPDSVHRILYLDGDILVTDDIAKLYNMNLKNNPVGMIADKFSDYEQYYNSGVIIIDVDMWKKEKITEKIIDYFHKNTDLFVGEDPEFLAPDQDLLNTVLEHRITGLPQKWNYLTRPKDKISDYSNCIYHFIGNIKPWHYPKKASQAYKLYYEYWGKSPLKLYKIFYYIKYGVIDQFFRSSYNIQLFK